MGEGPGVQENPIKGGDNKNAWITVMGYRKDEIVTVLLFQCKAPYLAHRYCPQRLKSHVGFIH